MIKTHLPSGLKGNGHVVIEVLIKLEVIEIKMRNQLMSTTV